MAVESGDNVALMTYEPDRDYFRKIFVDLSEVPEVLKVSGETCLMAIEHTKEIEAEKDGQKEKKTVFAGTTLILYQNGNTAPQSTRPAQSTVLQRRCIRKARSDWTHGSRAMQSQGKMRIRLHIKCAAGLASRYMMRSPARTSWK